MPLLKRRLRWSRALRFEQIDALTKMAGSPEELFEMTLTLVERAAKKAMPRAKMISPSAQYEDMFQAGSLGLLKACQGYRKDHESKAKFRTYAYRHIRGQMRDEGVRKERFFYIPDKVEKKLTNPASEEHAILEDTENYPRSLHEIVSTPQKPNRPPTLLLDTIPDPSASPWESAAMSVRAKRIHTCLAKLAPKEKEVLVRRFGIGGGPEETLLQIGARLGLTKERVRQIEAKAKEKLRRIYKEPPKSL